MVDRETVERMRRHYERTRGSGDEIVQAMDQAIAEFIDPQIEWIEPFGVLHGKEQVRQMIVSHAGTGAEYVAFLAEQVFPVRGKEVCVTGRSIGKYRGGHPIDIRWVHLWEFRDGRAVRFTAITQDVPDQPAVPAASAEAVR